MTSALQNRKKHAKTAATEAATGLRRQAKALATLTASWSAMVAKLDDSPTFTDLDAAIDEINAAADLVKVAAVQAARTSGLVAYKVQQWRDLRANAADGQP